TAQAAGTIIELISKIDPRTGQPLEDKPKAIKTGDSAVVRIRPLKPFCIEEFKEYPELGRFAMRDMGMTVAAGIVSEITEKETSKKTS
ncbi:MAG: elongation factor 1-alpha, partial [Nitrosopumilus sp.]